MSGTPLDWRSAKSSSDQNERLAITVRFTTIIHWYTANLAVDAGPIKLAADAGPTNLFASSTT